MNIQDLFDKSREWIPGQGDNNDWEEKIRKRRPSFGAFPKKYLALFVAFIVLTALLPMGIVFWTDLLWFETHGLTAVFWTRLLPQWVLFGAATVTSFLFFWLNWSRAWRIGKGALLAELDVDDPTPPATSWAPFGFALVLGIFNGLGMKENWGTCLRFLYRTPFGETDPLFGLDVGFYIFDLPFWTLLLGWVSSLLTTTLFGVALIYLMTRSLRFHGRTVDLIAGARFHLILLGGALLATWGLGYWLDRYDLLFSSNGVVYGAGYTDVAVVLPALTAIAFFAFLAAGLLLVNFFKPIWKLSIMVVGGLMIIGWGALSLLPGIVQQYIVKPNEYDLERPYLERHIASTRKAFGLERITVMPFAPEEGVTAKELRDDMDTVHNIRLWDYGPLLRTYKQLQEIRTYYDFSDIDIDRYQINERSQQVMLALREMDLSQLQNKTWVNSHLEFTHGYGMVMNPVNEVAPGGMPVLYMKDLPMKSTVPIPIDRPQIYYGERPNTYVLVKTDVKEFDYPMGDSNVRTTYEGKGGVEIGSLWRKLLFAVRFRDTEILFTGSLKPESRILYYRNIHEALRKIAPFLIYEDDAYPVVDGGRILWMQDAYTASRSYPYSRPLATGDRSLSVYNGINYIRNSVKTTIDAYDGTMTFYVMDENEPIVKTWMKIFPALFTSAEKMPDSLREHIRYPEEFFEVQSEIYRIYHMTDTNTYYNREDTWEVSPQGREKRIRPNYVTMKLQGQAKTEFTIIVPFMPVGRNNMIGWMAGRCDPPHYGDLIVYQFPKERLIFGPTQIEALINQNPDISAQLSLWSQRGSDVIRGDLLVVPVGMSILYVQPLYLKAENGDLPELKRLIVSTGGRVAWAETFSEALAALVGSDVFDVSKRPKETPKPAAPATPQEKPASPLEENELKRLAQEAQTHYDAAIAAQRKGDWTRYGAEIEALEAVLKRMIAP